MADETYQTSNYEEQGGATWVVGGELDVDGGKITAAGTQADNIAALTDNSGGTASDTLASISDAATKNAVASLAAKVNALIAAVQGVGITAAS